VETQAHGSLIAVLDVGVLLLGPSGIGKSECALELVHRGHQLVADDVVRIRSVTPARGASDGAASGPSRPSGLVGSAPEVIRHYMEIRGIGLLYVPDLYGAEAVRDEGTVDLICRIEEWREGVEFERVGIDRLTEDLAGVSLPSLRLPARPAGSMATLVEVAVRDHLQRRAGRNPARRLDARLAEVHGGQGDGS
jgi:HPr kinase/phosphorylase